MSAQSAAELLDRHDLLDLLVEVVRALVDRNYPGAEYGVLSVHLRDGVPDVMIPVIPASSSAARPRPQPV
jgi:hypothetical protein